MADTSKEEQAARARQQRYLDSLALEGEALSGEALAEAERFDREGVPTEQRVAELVARYRRG